MLYLFRGVELASIVQWFAFVEVVSAQQIAFCQPSFSWPSAVSRDVELLSHEKRRYRVTHFEVSYLYSTFIYYHSHISSSTQMVVLPLKEVVLSRPQSRPNLQLYSGEPTEPYLSSYQNLGSSSQSGPLKHCVLIDGSNSGCITDPATSYKKGLVRSKRTLKKLEIDNFSQLFVLKRVELNHKTRVCSAKSLGLPFLPSVSENDSKSAP